MAKVGCVHHAVRIISSDLSEAHVLFDGIDARLEVSSGSVHVGDHRADVTDDGGENQDAHLEDKTKSEIKKP